jgi:hypothetical protein
MIEHQLKERAGRKRKVKRKGKGTPMMTTAMTMVCWI